MEIFETPLSPKPPQRHKRLLRRHSTMAQSRNQSADEMMTPFQNSFASTVHNSSGRSEHVSDKDC